MGSQKFDQRYPAMFQPGGEGEAGELFVPSPPPPRDRQHAEPQVPAGVRAFAPAEPPPAGAFGAPARRADDAPTAGSSPEAGPPGLGGTGHEGHDHEGHEQEGADPDGYRGAPLPVRETRWSGRTWIMCLAAVLLAFAGSAFCVLAAHIIPGAAILDPTDYRGMMVVPWGIAIIPGASSLLTVALGMLALLFFMASWHYQDRGTWLRAAVVAVGLVALSGGAVALFYEALFMEMLYVPTPAGGGGFSYGSSYPWYLVFQPASQQLLVLGPAIIAAVVIGRPGLSVARGASSPKAAIWVGCVLTGSAVWTWFAPQFHPLAQGRNFTVDEQHVFSTTPWTYLVGQASGPLLIVGCGALMWCVLILATTRRTPAGPPFDDEPESVPTP